MTTRKMGWLPDPPDQRDYIYSLPPRVDVPPMVDLRSLCPAVYDQGALGSCTANAAAAAVEVARRKQGKEPYPPSRLFIYRHSRVLIGTVNYDSGAYIRDAIKTLADKGGPLEANWPYDISKFTVNPPNTVWGDAARHLTLQYSRIYQTLTLMQGRLATGLPFVIGFTVYDSFFSAPNGDVPLPQKSESVRGGHAVLIVGYDTSIGKWIFRNSWGAGWGNGGYGTFPFSYLLDPGLSSDFWAVDLVK